MSTVNVITLKCPGCDKLLKIKADMAGQRLACPKPGCGAAIDVPGVSAEAGLGRRAQLMIVVGLVFAVIAAVLTFRELQFTAAWTIPLTLVAAVVTAEFLKGYAKSGVLAIFTVLGLSTPAFFFILTRGHDLTNQQREWAVYIGAGLFFGLSSYLVSRTYSTWRQFDRNNGPTTAVNLESILVWFAVIASSLAFSWMTYYKFLTPLGQEEFIVRRLVFTLFFVVVGVICSVLGRNSPVPFLGVAGLIYMAAGVAKALAYDMTHLTGFLRIGVFAGCGAVLLLGGFLMMKRTPTPAGAADSVSPFIED
jgi:hypothetical protein